MSLTQSTLVLIKLKCFLSSHCILPLLTPPFHSSPFRPFLIHPPLSFQQSFITFNDLVSWEVQPVYIHLFTEKKKPTFNSQHIGILPKRLQRLWCKSLAMYVKPGAAFWALCRASQINTENMQCNFFLHSLVDTFCIVSNAGGVTSVTVSIMTYFVQLLLGFQITWI